MSQGFVAPADAASLVDTDGGGFVAPPDQATPASDWSDLPKNVGPDAVAALKGVAESMPFNRMPGTPFSPGTAENPSGSRVAEAEAESIPEGFKNLFTKEGWIKHPVQNTLTAASPLLGGGEEAPPFNEEVPAPAEEAVARTPKPEATTAAPETPARAAGPPPTPAAPEKPVPSVRELLEKAGNAIPTGIKDYVRTKAGGVANRPGWNETLSQYSKEHARNMALKSLGAAPGQIRKIGIPEAEKLADYALEKKIVGPATGDIGAREKIANLHQEAGETVGSIRDLATKRGAVHDIDGVVKGIRAKLDAKYKSGVNAGERGEYNKALQEVVKAKNDPGASNVAKTITDLFQHSKRMDRLKMPGGAYADVARELRAANEGLIADKLSPQELNVYHGALEDFGAATQLREFAKRKQSVEMGGRLGPGSTTKEALQKGFDTVGYRTQAQIANNISKWLKNNPRGTLKPQEIFRKYADEAADAVDEMGPGQ